MPCTAQTSDVATWEENGANDIGIRAESESSAVDGKNRSVVQRIEQIVAELRHDQLLNQLLAQLSSTAVSKHDLAVIRNGDRAGAQESVRAVGDRFARCLR